MGCWRSERLLDVMAYHIWVTEPGRCGFYSRKKAKKHNFLKLNRLGLSLSLTCIVTYNVRIPVEGTRSTENLEYGDDE